MAESPRRTDRIVLTGASGLVGSLVRRNFHRQSKEILQLIRNPSASGPDRLLWDPYAGSPADAATLAALEGVSAVIHLSGANVAAHRWTAAYKETIRTSRTRPTRALATLLSGLRSKPSVLICASAVGIYGDRGEELLDETSPPGSGFLANVCQEWEQAAEPAIQAGIRVVHLRFGIVLSSAGGALARMLPLFRLGAGGKLGSGRQWMSWIAVPDLLHAIEFAIVTGGLSGPVNTVAPVPVTNLDFTRTLGDILRRPTLLSAPAWALRMAIGEMADDALLASQRAIPKRLEAAGFAFQHRQLRTALESILSEPPAPSPS